MPEPVDPSRPWKYDYIGHYDLNVTMIETYLKTIWGNYKYYVEVDQRAIGSLARYLSNSEQRRGDDFRFWVPRKLKTVSHRPIQRCFAM